VVLQTPLHLNLLIRNCLERRAIEGDSPVGVRRKDDSGCSRVLRLGSGVRIREPFASNPKYDPRPIVQ
jgi:hypothetical protein